jgi:hypothetical protein
MSAIILEEEPIPVPPPGTLLFPYNIIAKRTQFYSNFGYCGECSFVTANMFYGQYFSQYYIRTVLINLYNIDNPTALIDHKNYNSQLRPIAGYDDKVAGYLKLNYELNTSNTNSEFITWMKTHVNIPIVIGVYMNYNRFYPTSVPDNNLTQGNRDYDHVVSITNINNNIYAFNDNGLWTGDNDSENLTPNDPLTFTYTISTNTKSRSNSNKTKGPVYSLPLIAPGSASGNFGIALTGLKDILNNEIILNNETVRIQITTPTQEPTMSENTNNEPPAIPLDLTIYLWNLDSSKTYNLYKFKDITLVPTSGFNIAFNNNNSIATKILFSGPFNNPHMYIDRIMSNDVAIYRCVVSA